MGNNCTGVSRRALLASAPLFVPAAALGRGGATAPSDLEKLRHVDDVDVTRAASSALARIRQPL